MAHTHHSIDYIEIIVDNVPESKSFYGACFGWTFTDYGPSYAGIKQGEKEAGGLCKGEPCGKGGVLVILYSDNLEQTEQAVREAGGAIVKEIFSFPGGRRFHFTDPSGNEMAVWSPFK